MTTNARWIPLSAAAALTIALGLASTCAAQANAKSDQPAMPPAGEGETIVTPTRAVKDEPPATVPDDQKNSPVIKSIPNIVVNRAEKTVTVEGFISPRMDMLELFACGNGIREHEAVVSLKARPRDVNVALILLGLEPGHPAVWTKDGEFLPPYGPVFRVFIDYLKDGERKRVEAHEWLLDTVTQKTPKPLQWVFCGGLTHEGHFIPDYEGTVVCLSNFAAPILDVPFESSAKNTELLYAANAEAIPPTGTPVQLVLQATGEVIEGKKLSWTLVIEKDGSLVLDGRPSSLEDLDEKLQNRDKYLQKVMIFIHPEGPGGKLIDAMNVITRYGTGVEIHKKVPGLGEETGKDTSSSAPPESPATKGVE